MVPFDDLTHVMRGLSIGITTVHRNRIINENVEQIVPFDTVVMTKAGFLTLTVRGG